MSVVGILKFALNFLHVLAWPLFALGFPICASIRAIENNSNSDTQKLVTYWISFSLVSLFEHFFMNLLEWIQFDGAFYVYNHLVRPYLLLNREVVVDEFNKWMVLLCKRDHFLAEAERYLLGNGPKALEKLIDKEFKIKKPNVDVEEIKAIAAIEKKEVEWSHYKEPDIVLKHNNVVEVTEKKEVPTIKRIVLAEPSLDPSLDQTDATMDIKGPNVAVAAAREFPDIHVSKEVQKEWACVICQVTTTSEKAFHEHLQGKNHKASYKALSAKKQPNIGVNEAIGVKKSTFKCNICNIHFSGKGNLTSHVKGKNHLAQVQVIYGCGDDWTCW